MISLSDAELAAIMEAARPIDSRDRDQFLRDVAIELSRYPEIGPGVVGRVIGKPAARTSQRAEPARRRREVGSLSEQASAVWAVSELYANGHKCRNAACQPHRAPLPVF